MELRTPSIYELRAAADALRLSIKPEDLEAFRDLAEEVIESYRRLERLGDPRPPVAYPRDGGAPPDPSENPFNGWFWRCSIKGATGGKLSGKKVALKDNVCVAGIPMMNGSRVLEGYVPDFDATIVTRILDAGGEIVGKAVCEDLCCSGGSHTSAPAPVLNPHKPGYASGGSSSGSAVLVATGAVDLAIGADQGGSIRIPSAWCGIVGLKPTYGLVPYTGIFPIDFTLDHAGPMARTVRDAALLLEVLAGEDGLDPRQRAVQTEPYSSLLDGDLRGIRVGVVEEGFGWPDVSDADVDRLVMQAAGRLEDGGATMTLVSIPLHREGVHIHNAIITEGAGALMFRGNAIGTGWKGYYPTSLGEAFGRARRERGADLSDTVKLMALIAYWMDETHQGRYYGRAQNLASTLRGAYDAAFARADILLMPTTPMKATPLPRTGAGPKEVVGRAHEMNLNTCPFDVTGHPALTVPSGTSQGLPVGMMLVGPLWRDAMVLRVGHAFERIVGESAFTSL